MVSTIHARVLSPHTPLQMDDNLLSFSPSLIHILYSTPDLYLRYPLYGLKSLRF